jgi:hypothetical protein
MEPTRRQVVQMLAALGLTGTAIAELAAQARQALGSSDVKGALALQGREMADDDLEVIRRALQRSLDQFEGVRNVEIDDSVAPATIFNPRTS